MREVCHNDMIDAFNSTSSYLDGLLNIDNIPFEQMVHRIYPAEPQLNNFSYIFLSETVKCESGIHPPVFDSTPIVPRLETQASGRRINIKQTGMILYAFQF